MNLEFCLGSSSLSGLLSLETACVLGSAWSILPSLCLSLETSGMLLPGAIFLELYYPSVVYLMSPGCDPVMGDNRAKQ